MTKENDVVDYYNLKLDDLTGKLLKVYMYQNVQNIQEIHEKLVSKELPCCIVKAELVIDPFQIAIAANKAVLNEKYGQMVTRSLFTEIIFNLSISKNITQSLTTFGISKDTSNILVILIHDSGEQEAVEKSVLEQINGNRVSITRLPEFSNVNLIKKTYKVSQEELEVSNLLDSIVSRISDKVVK
ncbi:hypothetical protein QAD02_018946 [Eretmocerus hayati]|uniref:Uncharacterized protein n=1 Tax=Eretmocerus hayati TaxID=131215 RepID=A0ACC2PHV2_9HYME|nr:hypothetical protein QAD02_018946 [Eretmocerus hayati]